MAPPFRLFQRLGIELEYMIVDAATLEVRPIADLLLAGAAGGICEDYECGPIGWSNELVRHVVELKTARPTARWKGLAGRFQAQVEDVNRRLAGHGARLLPTAMHPWMDPARETQLWPHGSKEIYEAFHRIFDCRGHGWSNLQSAHLNLPFADDAEFARLHAAIRILLPLLPALAASSPFVEGRITGRLDNRLEFYRRNCARLPDLTGGVIPESCSSRAEYQGKILDRVYAALAPHDPEGILRYEWANARGAIARFSRQTIEIRVLDLQECPAADLGLAHFIFDLARRLTNGDPSPSTEQASFPQDDLEQLFLETVTSGGEAVIRNRDYLQLWGWPGPAEPTVRQVCSHLAERTGRPHSLWRPVVRHVLTRGSLSQRLLEAAGPHPTRAHLTSLYSALADCLANGQLFG